MKSQLLYQLNKNTVYSKDRIKIFIILSMLLLFHGLNNYFILTKSRYCLDPDGAVYFMYTKDIFETISNIKLNLKSLHEAYIQIFGGWKPPLFFLTASPFLLFGIDKNIVIMSNLIYFAVLLFATYGIGKRLYNFEVGILSAFLVSMFPTIFAFSRVLKIDFALTAMVALTFYVFTVNKFNSLKFSLLTGIIIGLGSLTKQTYFVFLLLIIIYSFLQKNNLKNKKAIRNFFFSVFIGLIISASWYARVNFKEYLYHIFYNSNQSPYFYLWVLFNCQLFPIYFLLFLFSIVFHLRKKEYFLPVIIFTLLVLFSISPCRLNRYILPIFPYIAIMISGFVWSLTKIRRKLILALIFFSFLQYVIISYGNILPIYKYNFIQKFLSNIYHHHYHVDATGLFYIIDQGDWQSPAEEIITAIKSNYRTKKIDKTIRVLFISNMWEAKSTLQYLCVTKALPIEFYTPENAMADQFDFVIYHMDRFNGKDMESISARRMLSSFNQHRDKFRLIKTISFPNGTSYGVYKKITK